MRGSRRVQLVLLAELSILGLLLVLRDGRVQVDSANLSPFSLHVSFTPLYAGPSAGATNRPQELDEAARRRMTIRLYIPLPDAPARRQLVTRLLGQHPHSLSAAEIDDVVERSAGPFSHGWRADDECT